NASANAAGLLSVPVDLTGAFNVAAVAKDGTVPSPLGIDSVGSFYSAEQLGTGRSLFGFLFRFGTPNKPNGVADATIPLQSGHYAKLVLIGTGVQRKQPDQVFVVRYADGTSQ